MMFWRTHRGGYVLITFGGGITPVIQTCDTDLDQHVNRRYMELETAELLQQMRDGIVVPHCSQEQCIEMMADVLMNMGLHYATADGYKKTGDHMIVRGASVFFRGRDMRRKVTLAMEEYILSVYYLGPRRAPSGVSTGPRT
jgi:hypothetical protein